MKRFTTAGLLSAFVLAGGCAADGEGPHPPTSATSATTALTVPAEGNRAAAAFIAAWSRGDSEAMRQLAPADVVDTALRFGDPGGSPECSSQRSGQYQCIVDVPAGKRMYILVGEPGDRTGRILWASEYHPDS